MLNLQYAAGEKQYSQSIDSELSNSGAQEVHMEEFAP